MSRARKLKVIPTPEPEYFWDPKRPLESNVPICDVDQRGTEIPVADRCPRCAIFVGPRPGETYHCTAWRKVWSEDGKRIPKVDVIGGKGQFILL